MRTGLTGGQRVQIALGPRGSRANDVEGSHRILISFSELAHEELTVRVDRYAMPPTMRPDTGVDPGRGALAASRWQKVVGILGVLVILWVGNDTYNVIAGDFGSGGDGGGHGPSQDAPVENQDQETDTGNDGGGHRPPPPTGGHG